MPFYETVFIARQDITGAQVETITEDLVKILSDNGGKVTKTESWGLRSLQYRIKKNKKGHYVLMNIDAPSEAVAEMERVMRLNEDVLRHMTLRLDALDDSPSVMMRDDKSDRPDRRDRAA